MAISNGQRVKWTSSIGKTRYGTYITHMKSRPGYVHIKGDDGKAHIMRDGKPEVARGNG